MAGVEEEGAAAGKASRRSGTTGFRQRIEETALSIRCAESPDGLLQLGAIGLGCFHELLMGRAQMVVRYIRIDMMDKVKIVSVSQHRPHGKRIRVNDAGVVQLAPA